MTFFEQLAERKILEAQAEGAFENLSGTGKPLHLEDDSAVPEDLRMAYKILKNADCLPPELELHKEILRLQDMLQRLDDEQEKIRQIRHVNFLITRLNLMRKRPAYLELAQNYGSTLIRKLTKQD